MSRHRFVRGLNLASGEGLSSVSGLGKHLLTHPFIAGDDYEALSDGGEDPDERRRLCHP